MSSSDPPSIGKRAEALIMSQPPDPSENPHEDADIGDQQRSRLKRKKILVPIVLALIGGVLFTVAIALYPKSDDLSIPSYATINLNSKFQIETIDYRVTQANPSTAEIIIQILLPRGVGYPPIQTSAPELTMYTPAGFVFQTCPPASCVHDERVNVDDWTEGVSFKPASPSEGIGNTGEAYIQFFVKANHFGYAFNDINAAAAMPQVYYSGPGSPSLSVEYDQAPSPGDYDWSALPPVFYNSTTAVWQEPLPNGAAAGKVAVGVNHANQTRDNNSTFIAGALIGLAGAALLSAVQEALHAKD